MIGEIILNFFDFVLFQRTGVGTIKIAECEADSLGVLSGKTSIGII